MDEITIDTTLYRIDPARNMYRYYTVSIQPNLFGGHSLIRTWGRIGTGGQTLVDLFADPSSAGQASSRILREKLKRGYQE